jgi:hypothetical protein
MNYTEYINSEAWAQVRWRKLKEVGYKCEECNRKWELDVHHLTYERLGSEKMNDLIVLCKRCHGDLHYYEHRIPADEKMILQQTEITQEDYVCTTNLSKKS